MNGGENMGAAKKLIKKVVRKIVKPPNVVQPAPPPPVAAAPAVPTPVAQAPEVTSTAPAAATAAADPKPTAAETQVALKKKGKKPLIKTSVQGVLGDAITYKPTLLG
jgi:hypothetical protein